MQFICVEIRDSRCRLLRKSASLQSGDSPSGYAVRGSLKQTKADSSITSNISELHSIALAGVARRFFTAPAIRTRISRQSFHRNYVSRAQQRQYFLHTLLHRALAGFDHEVDVLWRFIGRGNAGEIGNSPFPGALIQAFGIPLLTNFQRAIAEYLNEILGIIHHHPHPLAVHPER